MRIASLIILASLFAAGCISTQSPATSEPAPAIGPASPPTLSGNVVSMDVPVPVFLIGFEPGTAAALADRLAPVTYGGGGAFAPTARFEVVAPDSTWDAAFQEFVATTRIDGNGDLTGFSGAIFDGNAIEAYLVEHLPEVRLVPDSLTALVVLDIGEREHAFHFDGDVGWREPVRTFGERSNLLVWDPHAAVDPWVGDAAPHHVPVGGASAAHIAAWVERATAIRALQMPIWPPTTAPCHAVTVLLAVRSTTVTPTALGLQSWEDVLDVPKLQRTFENLTQDPVFVDLTVRHLPADDPALEIVTRENNGRIVTAEYLDLNFDQYHVAHDGCEPYLSLVVYGDLLDQRTSSNGNAQMTLSGKRISTSLVAENVRVFTEFIGYNAVWDESTNFERVGPGADPHAWFNWVVSHETGHLFSLPHPNYSTGDHAHSDTAFASTWNVMGYQMRRIVTETSLVDTNNFARNQAAYAIVEAGSITPEVAEAMQEFRWKDATAYSRGAAESKTQ